MPIISPTVCLFSVYNRLTFTYTGQKMLLNLIFLLFISYATLSATGDDHRGGLLPNGNFEYGPKPSEMKGTVITSTDAVPNWKLSGYVEYIKSGQKQGDMILIVPDGDFAVRLGKDASMKQTLKVEKGGFYSVTFSAARTCAQQEKLNLSVSPNNEPNDWALLPMQTMYSSSGWDSYAWGFQADAQVVDFVIHNPGASDNPACGPIIDSVALKPLFLPKRGKDNLLKNGNFEEGPYILPNAPVGALIPPNIEDDHSPLPGWMIESLKAVKYIDSAHFAVPEGKFAVELIAGMESAVTQIVYTLPGKLYALTFLLGDANDGCEGPLAIKTFAGKESMEFSYNSNGKGGHKQAMLPFKADSIRTRIMFYSLQYTMKTDGTLCGPVIDDVRLVSVRNSHRT